MTLRRYYLPSPLDSEKEEGEPDSVMNLARAAWLAEYFYETHVNGTAAGISYAFNGKRDQ